MMITFDISLLYDVPALFSLFAFVYIIHLHYKLLYSDDRKLKITEIVLAF